MEHNVMKLTWYSAAPWTATGYGNQARLIVPRLAASGVDVMMVTRGRPYPATTWHDIPVISDRRHQTTEVMSSLLPKDRGVFTLFDAFEVPGEAFKPYRTMSWLPVYITPLLELYKKWLTDSGAEPLAMSYFGQRTANTKHVVPHVIDRTEMLPCDQKESRQAFNLPANAFIIGIIAANLGDRKALAEQLMAFSHFASQHDDALLFVRSAASGGVNLDAIAQSLRLGDRIRLIETPLARDQLVLWYNSLDVLSNVTCGEGFGVPLVEAQACGVLTIAAKNSAAQELAGQGWLAECQPRWVEQYHAWVTVPLINSIVERYEDAYQHAHDLERKRATRDFALRYDADAVVQNELLPVLRAFFA